ncbi:SGNH hydrolase-type esterase domain-containing protein, partial [Pyrenochaeta sp. MPI-SDFR-AT-0127]
LPLTHSLPTTLNIEARGDKSILLRILPLGDSITWGFAAGAQGSNGYRQQLLSDLQTSGYKVDFVGTQKSGNMADNDNQGHSGYRIKQIQDVAGPGLAMRPNIVLIHAGTNDFLQNDMTNGESWYDAPKRLTALIESVAASNPDALIIVAKIIQSGISQAQSLTTLFNNNVPTVVSQAQAKNIKITYVDQSVVGVNELFDGIHPSPSGYNHMGHIWAQGVIDASNRNLITSPR